MENGGSVNWQSSPFAGMLCIAVAIGKPVDPQALKRGDYPAGDVLLMMLAILVLATWVNVAVTVKRYHDRGKSGCWFLIVCVPYVGSIWQLVECGFLAGTPGPNGYEADAGSAYGGDIEQRWTASRPAASERSTAYQRLSGMDAGQQLSQTSHQSRPTGPTGFGKRTR